MELPAHPGSPRRKACIRENAKLYRRSDTRGAGVPVLQTGIPHPLMEGSMR